MAHRRAPGTRIHAPSLPGVCPILSGHKFCLTISGDSMSQTYHFRAVIQDAGDGGAYVIVPFDVEKTFGKKRLKIKSSIDGEPYNGTLVRMGGPDHLLLVLKEI